ncbi:MAG: phage head-tail adapter protein [Ruminococcus sp.]|uniref:phage head-tail adapter protein n=1 Tax=Ruminococcus sp. TaxID=41978 RepID=UPI0025EC6A3B|nr:phage head-tail adapter protein [Ruminococcus sp.]MBD9047502.1 phage head-tail adapter protein [Ruminococcus sp.]
MNKEWAELNKQVQEQLKHGDTFQDGILTLLKLRKSILNLLLELKDTLSNEQFSQMPFANAKGYHNKTIAYSIWHIARIEDIVAHTLIANDEQVFFSGNWQKKIGSPIITTGNELVKDEIKEFSQRLDIEKLYSYAEEVKKATELLLTELPFDKLKEKISATAKQKLIDSKCVSDDENAVWLIDYWCGKNIKGLIQMPFSRHLIMHTEAALRIAEKLK